MTTCWREGRKSKACVSACVACVDLNAQTCNLAPNTSSSGEGAVATVVCLSSSVTFVLFILLSLEYLWLFFGRPFVFVCC